MQTKRPTPIITTEQTKSLATASRATAQLVALAERQQREQISADREHEVRKQRLAYDQSWQKQYGYWLARVLLLPLAVLAAGSVAGVVIGVWSGKIKVISRYSSDYAIRAGSPTEFWLSVFYHGALAAMLVWMTYHCARASKLSGTRTP